MPSASPSILVVDDDPAVVAVISRYFKQQGWQVASTGEVYDGLAQYEREHPDLVLLDLHTPGFTGLAALKLWLSHDPHAAIMVLTGQGDMSTAVEAMRMGAECFLTKPVELDHLGAAAAAAVDKARLGRHYSFLRDRLWGVTSAESLGVSPQMSALADEVTKLARSDTPVLLTGETGTGKGWVAKLIHALSPRAHRPFVDVSCSGFSAGFLESELFGHEKGAFPDAVTHKIGLCEVASGGTLFLDEVGDLPPSLQAQVVSMLETQQFRRLGGTRDIPFDGRIIAATHHTLETAVRDGRMNATLYRALSGAALRVPPLRERSRDDLVYLTQSLLRDLRRGTSEAPKISTDAVTLLSKHDWPGNVRELRLTLERALMRSGSEQIQAYHLPFELRARGTPGKHVRMGDDDLTLDSVVKRHIANVVARFGGNRAEAARALGVTRGTIYNKLRDETPR